MKRDKAEQIEIIDDLIDGFIELCFTTRCGFDGADFSPDSFLPYVSGCPAAYRRIRSGRSSGHFPDGVHWMLIVISFIVDAPLTGGRSIGLGRRLDWEGPNNDAFIAIQPWL